MLIPPGSLLAERSFFLFWSAHAISEVGSRITYVVAPILVYQLTGSALGTGVLAGLQAVPYLLFGLVAGAIADRADRRRLMVGSSLLQTVILASIPIASAAGVLRVEQVFVVALLSATLFVWFDAANFGALPLIAGRDRLVEANAAVSGASSLIAVVAPAIAGVLAATIGPANAIGLDAVSYGLSAVALLLIRTPFSTRHLEAASVEPVLRRLVADVREGLRFLWGHRLVRSLTLLGFGVSFTGGAVTGLTVVYGVRALGLPDSGVGIGLLFSAAALGSLASSLLLPRLNRRYATGSITLAGLTVAVVAVAALALVTNFVAALVFFAAWGGAQTLVIINGISLRQQVAPDHLQGRVNVSARMIAWGGMPFGAAAGGALAQVTSVEATYLIMAVGVAISALIGWFSPLRTARAGPRVASTPAGGLLDRE